MASSFFKTIQETVNKTVNNVSNSAKGLVHRHIAGTIPHTFAWLTDRFRDEWDPNKNANPEIPKEEQTVIYAVHGTADRSVCYSDFSANTLDLLPESISGIHRISFGWVRGLENFTKKLLEKGFTGLADHLLAKGIEDFAKDLLDKIIADGYKHIILTGHSRGGLVVAYLKEYFAKELK